jgi:LysR family transcriptional regulator, regulator for bpeEF and oprC
VSREISLFAGWTHHAANGTVTPVADLDDLRVFERVGALGSFAAAAKALGQPRSNVSRSVARLEASLATRLIHRTTREVTLTPAGESLMARCASALGELNDALTHVGSLSNEVSGPLILSAGIGFGINVLSDQLPGFLRSFPNVCVQLDLTSRAADLVADRVDVAIRLGPLPDSSMVAVFLGEMKRALCAAPAYLRLHGEPQAPDDLPNHRVIEMPAPDGRARTWRFVKEGRTSEIAVEPRVAVNDALTIHRLVLNGAGIGIVSCYLCAPDLDAGRLVHLLPAWSMPSIPVNMVFPSRRELSPVVRAFVDYMKQANPPGLHWQNNRLSAGDSSSRGQRTAPTT